MTGRDPHENHRAATPLELLFDLTFVVSFGAAGSEAATLLAHGELGPALGGFGFAIFAISWAWINFTWFASAFDTDDWLFRVLTMVQMIGVVVLALGLPALFESIAAGETIDNRVLVIGYVIMRVALVLQWLRAARQDPSQRPVALSYATAIIVAQVGWVWQAFAHLELLPTVIISLVLFAVEMAGPVYAERKGEKLASRGIGSGSTPWHAHHIAERYGLLTIIALGEGVFGTIASTSAVIHGQGWTSTAVVIVVCGIGLTFGIWWTYFTIPAAPVLHRHRDRAFVWGYGHVLVFASIVAIGVGLHAAEYLLEGESEIGETGTVLALAVPVAVFMVALFGLYTWLMQTFDSFHILLFLGTIAVLAAAVVAAVAGAPIEVSLVLVTLSPYVVVVGYETVGHRHEAASLARIL
ncbi:low temperature requirement protein A [Microbacteriaceae bacterium VKM Ac-2855]|nr:low temperature requirement protein A [Microbacteriaceae bacterium VKM Ac-2855]